jgi:hypothetical protein
VDEKARSLRNSVAGPVGLGLLAAALVLFCSFRAGGYFPGTPALLAVGLCVVLVLRVTLAERPLAGASRGLVTAVLALGLFAGWAMASATWSNSTGRALFEFDRALFYLLVLLVFGLVPGSAARARWLVRLVAAAFVVVIGLAACSRLLPDLLSVAPRYGAERLSYPLTYWNSLGLMSALGAVFALHLASDVEERAPIRVAGAAALPLCAVTGYLTLSRASIVVAVVGLVAYAVLGRPRALLSGVVAGGPLAAVAAVTAYHADLLSTVRFDTAAGRDQGHHVALVLVACMVGAAVLRVALLALDPRLRRFEPSAALRRTARLGAAAAVVVLLVGAVAPGAAGRAVDQVRKVTSRSELKVTADARSRLTDLSNNGRRDMWDVSLDAFRAHPLRGAGAGTFEVIWAQNRPISGDVVDGHSLYFETLGELGIPGLALLLVAVGAVLVALFRARRRGRAVHGALLAAGIAWALHALVDWDWEMPAVTVWFWAAGGMALAAPVGTRSGLDLVPTRIGRVVAGLACLILAVMPYNVARSQGPLVEAVRALRAGDCARAIPSSLDSIDALGVRADPFTILGYCDARIGQTRLAVQMMGRAVRRDPDWWETHYGLAVVRARAGLDPRAEARRARRLNPREPLAQNAVREFGPTSNPQTCKRRALSARLPLN